MPKDIILGKSKDLLNSPGVYLFKDKEGKIIYIGKSNNVKNRILNHINSPIGTKSFYIVNESYDLEVIYTQDETKAYLLEEKLIKKYQPKYNVQFKDDKTYPYLAVTQDEYPKLVILRKDNKSSYIYKCGPFINVKFVKNLKEFLEKTFKLRTCQNLKKTACLKYHIGECSAPCINKISKKEYLENLNLALKVLKGDINSIQENLIELINTYAEKEEFEKALFYKNVLEAIKNIYRSKYFEEDLKIVAPGPLREKKEDININIYKLSNDFENILNIPFPFRAEGFDISSFYGKVNVGSCVVFIDGKPEKSEYRKYYLKVKGVDDYKCLEELLFRRFRRIKEEKIDTDLILIDGGKGQLNLAKRLKSYFNLNFYLVALAKGETRKNAILYTEDGKVLDLFNYPELLKYFISIRDEAHRFAQSYLWQKVKKLQFEDILSDIKGLGKKRLLALKNLYKNLYELSQASIQELVNIGIPKSVAQKILEKLKIE